MNINSSVAPQNHSLCCWLIAVLLQGRLLLQGTARRLPARGMDHPQGAISLMELPLHHTVSSLGHIAQLNQCQEATGSNAMQETATVVLPWRLMVP